MSCPKLCTAAKCAELEARLAAVEQALELIEASFEAHTSQAIPEAHEFNPEITVNTAIDAGELITDITVNGVSDFSTVPLPDNLAPSVTLDIFEPTSGEYVFKIGVNGEFDEDTLLIKQPAIDLTLRVNSINEIEAILQYDDTFINASTPLPRYDVAIDTFETGNNNVALVVQVGAERDQTILNLPNTQHIKSNLKISASYFGDILTISVADGESQDTAQVSIDRDVFYGGGGGGGVSCEGFEQKLEDCCNQLLIGINNNYSKLQELESYVTIDVSSTVNSDYKCEFPQDENNQPVLTYAEATLVEKEFLGQGIAGLNERLKFLAINQDAIYQEICKAIDPIRTISRNDLYQFCNDSDINRNDYPDTPDGTELYNAAVENHLLQLLSQSKYGYLINADADATNGVILSAPASYINGILADFALIQGRNNSNALCAIAEAEQDTVTLVAQEQDIGRIEGNVLVLHFVTLDNYPKRTRGSNKRPIRIPAPKPDLDWDADFKDIRWQTGNQYAKLKLKGWKQGITGWFADANAANACFDQLVQLTTAEENGRNIPNHTDGRSDIVVRTERPYRAFLAEETTPGNARTLTKFYPFDETE